VPDGERQARIRADTILAILERSDATDFLERIGGRANEEVRLTAAAGGSTSAFYFAFLTAAVNLNHRRPADNTNRYSSSRKI
jgi:hypothetical protein